MALISRFTIISTSLQHDKRDSYCSLYLVNLDCDDEDEEEPGTIDVCSF